MAFEHLCGQVMTDSNGTTYIISDNFSVIYPGDAHPDVYEWADISAVKIDKSSITVTTGKQTYHIPDRAFTGRAQFTAAKTLILSQVSDKETVCDVSVEVLPDKRFYSNYDIPDSAVFAKGEYNPKEIRSSVLSLVLGKMGRLLWCIGILACVAIGDVLFGDVNPSGKLTMTFPKNVGQIPLFYNHKNTGRPLAAGKWFEKFRSNYLDVDNEPLYPFGYGLSYTTFQYSDIALSTPTLGKDGSVTAVVTVTNTGKHDGAEVVQLYIRDLVGSITRPVRELKGFNKIFLRAGESKTVSFTITRDLLRFYDYDLNYVAEPGDFDIMIGGNSQAVKTAKLTLK